MMAPRRQEPRHPGRILQEEEEERNPRGNEEKGERKYLYQLSLQIFRQSVLSSYLICFVLSGFAPLDEPSRTKLLEDTVARFTFNTIFGWE